MADELRASGERDEKERLMPTAVSLAILGVEAAYIFCLAVFWYFRSAPELRATRRWQVCYILSITGYNAMVAAVWSSSTETWTLTLDLIGVALLGFSLSLVLPRIPRPRMPGSDH
jgi:hypothetical protein